MRAVRLLSLGVVLPFSVFAQAWLSPQGDGTVSTLYQYTIDRLHAYSDGQTRDKGHTYIQSLLLNTDYSITDRLAVSVGLRDQFVCLLLNGRNSVGTSYHL